MTEKPGQREHDNPQTPETGWLIESNHVDGTPHWFALGAEFENGEWTKDSVKALRFARKQDAEAYIYDIGWTVAVATEHAWDRGPI